MRNGRWGPYIVYKKKNYKIPKADADRAANLTAEECYAIVKNDAPRKASSSSRTTRTKTARKAK